MSNSVYPDQAGQFVGPDLDTNCLQRLSKCGSRGGGGQGVWTPPGKSQVTWVSIGNKLLDPPPGKSWTPPPSVQFCVLEWTASLVSELLQLRVYMVEQKKGELFAPG